MAVSAAAFTNGSQATASSKATASKTWVLNRLYFFWVLTELDSGTALAPTVTGATKIASQASVDLHRLLTLFLFLGDGSTGTKTIDYSGITQNVIQWVVDEWQGTVITGTNGSAAIVQSVGANASTGQIASVTLATFASGGNGTTFCMGGPGVTLTPKAGFTGLSSNAAFSGVKSEYLASSDTTPNMTWSGNAAWLALGVEVAASGGGASAWGPQLSDQLNRIVQGI